MSELSPSATPRLSPEAERLADEIWNLCHYAQQHGMTDGLRDMVGRFVKTLPSAEAASKPLLDAMVDRFLGWKLPEDFHPDAGISFQPYFNVEWNAKHGKPPQRHEPIGTNLLTADQAKAMLEYVVGPFLKEMSPHSATPASAVQRREPTPALGALISFLSTCAEKDNVTIPGKQAKALAEELQALLSPLSATLCRWTIDEDGVYRTGCGYELCYDAPLEDCDVEFCQCCGGKVHASTAGDRRG